MKMTHPSLFGELKGTTIYAQIENCLIEWVFNC